VSDSGWIVNTLLDPQVTVGEVEAVVRAPD
jgi:hypothetical protein